MSSAQQDDELTMQSSRATSRCAAAAASPTASASNARAERIMHPIEQRLAIRPAGSRRSEVIAAPSRYSNSPDASQSIAEFSFPPDLQDPILSARRYRIAKELGEGTFGKVLLVWDERRQYTQLLIKDRLTVNAPMGQVFRITACRLLVAVKTQHKQRRAGYQEAVLVAFLRREMAAMRELHHENVVEWFHTIETCTDIYAVLEFCSGGTLSDCIKKKNGIPKAEVQLVFVQLSDFGLSRCLYDPYRGTTYRRIRHMFTVSETCTASYASPEVSHYNPLVNDLWCLGVVLHELLFARLPFPIADWTEVYSRPDRGLQRAEIYDLLVGMLLYKDTERFVMRDVMLHHWTARAFVRYETQRLGLPDGSYKLPPEELTMLPYRLSLEQCDDLQYVHNVHHIARKSSSTQKYATASFVPVHEVGQKNPEAGDGQFLPKNKKLRLLYLERARRFPHDWREVYKNTADFGAKETVLEALTGLTEVQNLRPFNNRPVQDALSLLHAVLLFYKANLITTAQWDEICQEACVKLHSVIRRLHQLKEHFASKFFTEQATSSQERDLQNDVEKIDKIIDSLQTHLKKLDEFTELRSLGFVERNLRKFSNATGHYGVIDLKGEFIECTSDGRPLAIPTDAHNRFEQSSTQPARSLDDLRTVAADLLRSSVLPVDRPTEAAASALDALTKIRTLLPQREENIDRDISIEEIEPNISFESARRLRNLAIIEADALEAYLKSF